LEKRATWKGNFLPGHQGNRHAGESSLTANIILKIVQGEISKSTIRKKKFYQPLEGRRLLL